VNIWHLYCHPHSCVPLGSLGAAHAADADDPQLDVTKTLEVQINRILREQKMKLGKMKRDNASLRSLLENESAVKTEPLPGLSVMLPLHDCVPVLMRVELMARDQVMARASRLAEEAEVYA
jgi:hypothetical protein